MQCGTSCCMVNFSPTERAFAAYEPAYRIVMKFLEALRG